MSDESGVNWCDSTVNPVMGCEGCELWNKNCRVCYAGLDHQRKKGINPGFARDFGQPELFPGRMDRAAQWPPLQGRRRWDRPWLDGLPRLIFVSDMGDALCRGIGFEDLYLEIIRVVRSTAGSWQTTGTPSLLAVVDQASWPHGRVQSMAVGA